MSVGGRADDVGDDLLRAGLAWIDALTRAGRSLSQSAGSEDGAPSGDSSGAARPTLGDLFGAMTRAQLAFAAAGLDYGRRIVEAQAQSGSRVGETVFAALAEGRLTEVERRELLDEARAYMREVATATTDEARHVARALAEIDRRLAAAVAPEETAGSSGEGGSPAGAGTAGEARTRHGRAVD